MIKRKGAFFCFLVLLFVFVKHQIFGVPLHVRVHPQLSESPSGTYVSVIGRVCERAETSNNQILYLKDNRSNYLKQSKTIIYTIKKQEVHIGDTVQVRGEVKYFESPRNPGNFDEQFYYAKQGIGASIYANKIIIIKCNPNHFLERLSQLRGQWKEKMVETLGERQGNTLSAILLGDKSGMDSEIKELYQRNGIGHIMAISGLHISFLSIGCYQLFRKLGLSYCCAGGIGIFVLIIYVLMVGIQVSTLRACIMFIIRVGGDIIGRNYDMMTSLGMAAVIVVLWRPLSIYDVAFLLSFGAILGLLLFLPILQLFDNHCSKKSFKRFLFQSYSVYLSIQLVTFPIILYFYFEIPLFSFLLNLIVIPTMPFLLGGGIIGSLCQFICAFIGNLMLNGCGMILMLYEVICKFANRFAWNRLILGQPNKWQIVIYYFLLLLIIIYTKLTKVKRDKKRILVIMLVMTFGMMWISSVPLLQKEQLKIQMIDVGQGDGIFIRGPKGKTYLIDGGSSSIKSVGKYRIEPFLKSQGVGIIDYVFITHGDADHLNAIQELIVRKEVGVRIKQLVFPVQSLMDERLKNLADQAKRVGILITYMEGGMQIKEGNLTITCIQPEGQKKGSVEKTKIGNESSMVLKATYEKFSMLFTGDVEGQGEQQLIANHAVGEVDVLKVSHHGSKNATSIELLEKLRPSYAFISAGINNQYGHPHATTIQRLKSSGVHIYNTQKHGAITIITNGHKMKIAHYWMR